MARKYKQGFYKPTNPQKYKGKVDSIIYRSGWELACFKQWDSNPRILAWSSEEVVIPYISPLDNKQHRYFIDAKLRYRNRKGNIEEAMIEIKPYDQCRPPKQQKRITAQYKEKVRAYLVNKAKWDKTIKVCQASKMKFVLLTERGSYGWDGEIKKLINE